MWFCICCKAAFWIQEMLPRLSDVKRSVVLRSVFAISNALTYCFPGIVALLHTSRYITARDSVLPGLPCVSMLGWEALATRLGFITAHFQFITAHLGIDTCTLILYRHWMTKVLLTSYHFLSWWKYSMPIPSLGVRRQRGSLQQNIMYNNVIESIIREQGFMEY